MMSTEAHVCVLSLGSGPGKARQMQNAHPLIHTKIRLPAIRPHLVPRPRLQQQILQGAKGPLTLIVAPAGFGKTTLVASCAARCSMPVAWLSLDKNDSQPERFLNYLIAALQETDGVPESEAAPLRVGMQQVAFEVLLTRLINSLDRAGKDILLVVDDYHFISSPDVHQQMAFLIEHCPQTLHLLIATRSDPPLPLARLRARGQLVELRAADLRFSKAEAAQFLNEMMGLRLDTGWVDVLEERTEGWIAGLQMAALSVRDREDVRGFIEEFSGTNRYILDYLLEEVLASQPPEIKQFLLQTSILERLTARLCEAVLQAEASEGGMTDRSSSLLKPFDLPTCQQALEYLERANLFLVALDDKRQSYRYHHLFADLLRNQLQKSLDDEELARLHLRASEWHEQNGLVLEAIHHASLARDFERIERLIEQNYAHMLNRGEMSGILRFWMGRLDREWAQQRPWLSLYQAFSHSWFGQLEEARVLLKEAEKRIRSESPGPATRAMLGYHAYVQSRVTAMEGDTRQAIEYCLMARENIPEDNVGLQIEVGITLGYVYFLYGDLSHACKTLYETLQLCQMVKAINNSVAAYALLARASILQGRLHDARDLFRKAAAVIDETGGQVQGAIGLVEVGVAALDYEWNSLETALAHVKRGLELLPSWGKADDSVLAYVTLSRIQLALGNKREAASAMEKADQLMQTCGVFSEARSALETSQVRLWLANENWPEVDRWAASLRQRNGSPELIRYEEELTHITQARIFLAQNKPDQALLLLGRLEEAAQLGGRYSRLIEITALQALVLQTMSATTKALLALTKSLELAEPDSFVRIFLDEGPPMQQLLAQWLARASSGPPHKYAARLLSEFDGGARASAVAREKTSPLCDGIESLSRRELEVLHLMALGKTNREIAGQLIVSPGTVKAHTASIYRKLNVANRTEAVGRARGLGILP